MPTDVDTSETPGIGDVIAGVAALRDAEEICTDVAIGITVTEEVGTSEVTGVCITDVITGLADTEDEGAIKDVEEIGTKGISGETGISSEEVTAELNNTEGSEVLGI